MTRSLKIFQLISKVEALTLKNKSTEIHFDKKMAKIRGKEFILTINFYYSTNKTSPLVPGKSNPGVKPSIYLEGTAVKQQYNRTTKQQVTRKINANKLRTKLINTREYSMCTTAKNLHYIVNGAIEVC